MLKTLAEQEENSVGFLFIQQQSSLSGSESAKQICSLLNVIQSDVQGAVSTEAVQALIKNTASFIKEEYDKIDQITEKREELLNAKEELQDLLIASPWQRQIQEKVLKFDEMLQKYDNFLEEAKQGVIFCKNLEAQGTEWLEKEQEISKT